MTDHPTVVSLRQLLEAGFPRTHIVREAERHLESLRELVPEVPDRDAAIEGTERFLAEIKGSEH